MRGLFLGTPLPEALAAEARAVVELLRGASPQAEKSERAFRFIYAVGEEALDYHFAQPLTRLGVSAVTRGAVELALGVALKSLRPPLRHLLHGMDEAQLRGVADAIEFRLYPDPHAPEPGS
jgi:hypothetical protein